MENLLRGVLIAIVVGATIVVLFLYVFPWVESRQQDPTLEAARQAPTAADVQLVRSPR